MLASPPLWRYHTPMKTLITLIALAGLAGAPALAQEAKTSSPVKISATEAKEHVNADAIVTGKIVEVNKTARVIHLNFEKPYPNTPFEAVIFSTSTNLFPEVDKLKDKTVRVSGKITEYRGRTEIVLTAPTSCRLSRRRLNQAPGRRNRHNSRMTARRSPCGHGVQSGLIPQLEIGAPSVSGALPPHSAQFALARIASILRRGYCGGC